ncbi:beta-N-acetylhexosaminidase family protein [Nonomuraea indica]|uniref:beta-N-acetylhexosaminidase family protein n=1 Tax=Nonomuraea indica TaxID=1581193 RepID=UPI0015DDF214|nr:beta-N-acetylglucosaminidase domain-containing protein [Nonomuraea indica]
MNVLDWVNPAPRKATADGSHLELGRWAVTGGDGTATAVAALRDGLAALDAPGDAATSLVPVRVDVEQGRGLPPEGYALTVSVGDGVRVTGADPAGAFYGAQTLLALACAPCERHRLCLPAAEVRDWPELPTRGTIEGFYGRPWTHADRLAHLRFSARHKLNTYVYAPKDDPYHRERWREPYPEADLARLAELAGEAAVRHVRFVFALSPGLSMVYGDPAERSALRAKAAQVWDAGVREFALLFDDIPPELPHDRDRALFGASPGAVASAHAAVCRDFAETFLAARGAERPLTMVPTDYAGTGRTPYRDRLADELPPNVLVWWTGRDVVVGAVTADEIRAAAASYGHRVTLWDNFPVNDFDPHRVFLGPLTGRATGLDAVPLAGITANPMVEAAASQLALATVADYAWHPAGYDQAAAHRRAVRLTRGAAELEPLIAVCSSWPPSADQSPALSALCATALDERGPLRPALDRLREELGRLAGLPADVPGRLGAELRPWVAAGRDMAAAGLAALDLLAATEAGDAARERYALGLRAALARAEGHEANVLRGVLPPFARAVLERADGA